MPADNLNGFRADIVAEFKKIGPTMFAGRGTSPPPTDWRDGIGDPEQTPAAL